MATNCVRNDKWQRIVLLMNSNDEWHELFRDSVFAVATEKYMQTERKLSGRTSSSKGWRLTAAKMAGKCNCCQAVTRWNIVNRTDDFTFTHETPAMPGAVNFCTKMTKWQWASFMPANVMRVSHCKCTKWQTSRVLRSRVDSVEVILMHRLVSILFATHI